MPLQDQILSVSFNQGIETKVDLKQGVNGRLLALNNAVFTGVTSLEKRNGYQSLSNNIIGGGTISSGNSIATFNNSLVMSDSSSLYNYSQTENAWETIGAKTGVSLNAYPLGTNALSGQPFSITYTPTPPDDITYLTESTVAVNETSSSSATVSPSGIIITSWVQANPETYLPTANIGISYFDGNSNSPLQSFTINTNNLGLSQTVVNVYTVKVVYVNGEFQLFFYYAGNSSNFGLGIISLSATIPNGSYSLIGSLTTGQNNGAASNIDVATDGTYVYVNYLNTSGAVVLSKFSSGSLVSTLTLNSSASSMTSVDYESVNGNLWVTYYINTSGVTYATVVSAASFTATTTITLSSTALPGNRPYTAGGLLYNSSTYIIYLSCPVQGYQAALTIPGVGDGFSAPTLPSQIIKYVINVPAYTLANTAYTFLYTCVMSAKPFLNQEGKVIVPSLYNYSYVDYYIVASANGPLYISAYLYNYTTQATYFLVEDLNPTGSSSDYSIVCNYSKASAPLTAPSTLSSVIMLNNNYLLPYLSGVNSQPETLYLAPQPIGSGYTLYNSSVNVGYNYIAEVIKSNYNIVLGSFNFASKIKYISLANNLNAFSGSPYLIDESGVAESGFNVYPEPVLVYTFLTGYDSTQGYNYLPSISQIATPGNYSWSYSLVYNWVDAYGNIHRSSPSVAKTALTLTTNGSAGSQQTFTNTIYFMGTALSEDYKRKNITVDVYRTTANGSVYYKIGSVSDAYNQFTSFVDNNTDDAITGNEQLYTTGGEVENISPPTSSLATAYKNRIILVDAENPLQWWYSKQVIQDFPVEYSDLFTQNIDQKGGNITALSTMDDKLIFFKASNIWYVTGDGPAPNGQNNDFSYPQLISSDTGCVNQDSIVLTPSGLLFQSPKGIYLLDRGLGMSYIGAPVEAYNSDTVTSAVMIANTNQVRFTLNTGVALVYDYYVKQWSVFTNVSAVDSVIYMGNMTFLTSAGIVNEETPGQYLDNGSVIPLSFTTGWLKLSDLQGFERLKKLLILGQSTGASTISTSFNYDYDTTNNQPISSIPVSASTTRMQYRIFPPRQKGEAFQLVFSETPSASSAGVTSVSNIALEIGIKKGPFKLPAGNSFG